MRLQEVLHPCFNFFYGKGILADQVVEQRIIFKSAPDLHWIALFLFQDFSELQQVIMVIVPGCVERKRYRRYGNIL